MTAQLPQVTHLLWRQPYARQITHPREVRQQPGIAVVGLVRRLLEPRDVTRMRHLHTPAAQLRQFLAEVRSAAAGFDGHCPHIAQAAQQLGNRRRIVCAAAIEPHVGQLVDGTELKLVLMVVHADKHRYIAHDPLLPDETLVN